MLLGFGALPGPMRTGQQTKNRQGRIMGKGLLSKYKGKKIFRNMFSAVFILPALCIFLACIWGFCWFRASRIETEKVNDGNTLYASSLMVSNYMDLMGNTMEVLRNDTYVKKALAKSDFSWDGDMSVAAQKVLNMVMIDPMFQSVYVLKGNEYRIKCSNPAYPLDEQADRMIIETFYQSQFGRYGVKYYIDIYGCSRTLLYITAGEQNPGTGEKESGIFIGLDMGKIMENIFQPRRQGEQYLLTDAEGNVVHVCGEGYAKGEQLQEEILRTLLEHIDVRQSEVTKVRGGSYLVSCVNMENGFYLMHFLPYKYVEASIVHMRNTFIGIVLLLVLLVLLFAFVMSNWVYSPIDAAIQTTNSAGTSGQPSENISDRVGKTELAGIVQTYRTMVQTMNDLNIRKDQEEMARYLCSRASSAKLPEWVEETYGKTGIHSRVICLRISDMKDLQENHTEEARIFVHHTLVNITEQALKPLGDVLVNPVDEEYTAVILFAEQNLPEEELTGKIREIFSVIRDLVHISMDAGISNDKEGFAELSAMYQMARAATAYRFMYGIDAIVTEEQMARKALGGNGDIDIRNLLLRLKEGNREKFAEEYFEITNELKEYSIQTAQDILLDMAVEIMKYYNSLNFHFETLSRNDYEKLAAELGKFGYLDDTWEWFSGMQDKICELLARARQGDREDVVDKAMAYLRENYADPNISAQFIAEMYHITPSYFSRLFNERSGYAFPDYLATLRIEEAGKLLMKEANKSIQEICEMVGYTNASYFTATFKKKFGITPGQFRKKHAQSAGNLHQ